MAKESKSILKMDVEKAQETPMVELAYDLLKLNGKPMEFREIMDEVAKLRAMTPEEVTQYIAMLYTEINMDGRFICIARNTWGLKRWYPVDKTMDKAAVDKKFIRKAADFDDDDDDFLDEELEEEDLVYHTDDDDAEDEDENDGFTEVDVDDEEIEEVEEVEEEFDDDEDAEEASDDDDNFK